MIAVRRVAPAEIFAAPNWPELLREYSAECSNPLIGEADPDAAVYAEMRKSSAFACFGVFAGDVLAGFATELVYMVPHYSRQQIKVATVESLFVALRYRNRQAGNALMNMLEDHARANDCAAILYSARAGSQFERLLELLKPYERTNSVFTRAL